MTAFSDERPVNPNPANMHELSVGETILIRSIRRWIMGMTDQKCTHFQKIMQAFNATFPDDHVEALSSTIALFREVAKGARRTLHHHQPDCPCFGADEIALVTMVAAVQGREIDLARKLAVWIVKDDHVETLIVAAERVARVFEENGIAVPLRQASHAPHIGNPAPVTHSASMTVH